MVSAMRCLVLMISLVLSACNSSGDPGNQNRNDPDASQLSCPDELPTADTPCADQAGLGASCVYDRCAASDRMVSATCAQTAGLAQWSVTEDVCESDCAGFSCTGGSLCVAQVGGAFLVGCREHSCGDGPLTCDCVCGDETQCEVGDSISNEAEFTCYIDCGAEICA
jgi:hypothetical protein